MCSPPKGVEAKAVISVRFLRRKIEEYEALRAETENLQAEAGGGVSFWICRFGAGIQAIRAQIVWSRKFSAEFTRFNYA